MPSLPEDIQIEILSRLPVKSLLRFKSVCKHWYNLFHTPSFSKKHLHRGIGKNSTFLMLHHWYGDSLYSMLFSSLSSKLSSPMANPLDEAVRMDYPALPPNHMLHLSGSYNGLLCLKAGGELPDCADVIFLWNPSTMEYKNIPDSPNHFSGSARDASLYGLGYDKEIDDFKLVKVRVIDFYPSSDSSSSSGSENEMYEDEVYEDEDSDSFTWEPPSDMSEVEVYTLGSNSWKTCEMMPYCFPTGLKPGVVVNGDLHWWAIEIHEGYEAIISFDMTNEVFKEVAILDGPLLHPNYCDLRTYHNILGALDGCICLLHGIYGVKVDVWVMQEYGLKESWTRRFTITSPSITKARGLRLVCDFENGGIMFDTDDYSVYYNPNNGSDKIIVAFEGELAMEKYVSSLESLKSGTYVKTTIEEPIEEK